MKESAFRFFDKDMAIFEFLTKFAIKMEAKLGSQSFSKTVKITYNWEQFERILQIRSSAQLIGANKTKDYHQYLYSSAQRPLTDKCQYVL